MTFCCAGSAVDGVIFDLEDSVAPEKKAPARAALCERVRAGGYGPREVMVRLSVDDLIQLS